MELDYTWIEGGCLCGAHVDVTRYGGGMVLCKDMLYPYGVVMSLGCMVCL